MTAPRRPNPLGGGASFRGIVVLVVAVIVGIVLLAKGSSNPTTATSGTKKSTTTVTTTPLTTTTTTTVPTTNAPANVTVAVANGTGGRNTHASSQSKAKLAPAGYAKVTILNDLTSPVQTSAVYFTKPTAQGDAFAIAQVLGLSSSTVRSATGATLPPGAGDAQVVVVIGVDQTTSASSSSTSSTTP